jgi:hypothetical protein
LDANKFLRSDTDTTASGTITVSPRNAAKLGIDIISNAGIPALAGLRISTQGANHIIFGSGATNYDTNLYRSAADTLKTDDAFHVAGTLSGARLVISGNATFSGSLSILRSVTARGTYSGSVVHAEKSLTSSGSIKWKGSASGSSIWVSTFDGAGLTDCDLTTNVVRWDTTTKKFSCGTVSAAAEVGTASFSGSTLRLGDARYVKKQGDTMTGALAINLTSGYMGLRVLQMMSGSVIHAEKSLTSSGTILAVGNITSRGTISGALLTQGGVPVVTATYFSDVLDPNGIQDPTESTMSFNAGSRTFSIAPSGSSFDYYLRGTKIVRTTSTGVVIPDTTGTHYIYFDSDRQLKSSLSAWEFTDNKAFVATVYWRAGGAVPALLTDERHGIAMDWATHRYLHNTVGTRYESGLTGTFQNNGLFTVTAGVVHDEDLRFSIPQQKNTRILYRDGSSQSISDASGSLLIKESAGVIQYDDGDGTPAAVGTNAYVAYWVFATNEVTNPVLVVMGQRPPGSGGLVRALRGCLHLSTARSRLCL